jgi:hypothetical protein
MGVAFDRHGIHSLQLRLRRRAPCGASRRYHQLRAGGRFLPSCRASGRSREFRRGSGPPPRGVMTGVIASPPGLSVPEASGCSSSTVTKRRDLTNAEIVNILKFSGLTGRIIEGFPVIAAVMIRRRKWVKPPAFLDTDTPVFACPWAGCESGRRAFLAHGPATSGAVVDEFVRGSDGRIVPERFVSHCRSANAPEYYWIEPIERLLRLLPRHWINSTTGRLGPHVNWHLAQTHD